MKVKDQRGKCLTDDEVTSYVDGVVGSNLRKRIEDHLARCSFCLHNVAELKCLVAAESAAGAPLPEAAMARAAGLIARQAGSSSEFDITLAIRGGVCRLLETTGNLLLPVSLAPAPVRGERRPAPGLRVAKSLSGYLVTLEMISGKQAVEPTVTIVEEASSAKPDGIKAKLYTPGAAETKYSRAGKMRFSALKPGAYRIDIEEIGTIRLDIQ